MSSSPTSSPQPQQPTEDTTSSPPHQTDGDRTAQSKKVDFWPIVFRCMDVEPKINYEKLAKEMGFKSAQSARNCYSLKLKKLGVERVGVKAKSAAAKTGRASKVSKQKPKDTVPRKTRARKPAAKKAEEQKDGPEKVAEEA